jgi:serine/threonine-protein kinase
LVPDPDVVGGERVKILDFGVAKLLEERGVIGSDTKTGTILGSPQYMSPEQCVDAKKVDLRTDIYSLGALGYLMLTGRLPYQAKSFGQLLVMQQGGLPPGPHAVNSAVPEALGQVILRALAREPGDRFASMQAFGEGVQAALAPPAAPAPAGEAAAPPAGEAAAPPAPDRQQLQASAAEGTLIHDGDLQELTAPDGGEVDGEVERKTAIMEPGAGPAAADQPAGESTVILDEELQDQEKVAQAELADKPTMILAETAGSAEQPAPAPAPPAGPRPPPEPGPRPESTLRTRGPTASVPRVESRTVVRLRTTSRIWRGVAVVMGLGLLAMAALLVLRQDEIQQPAVAPPAVPGASGAPPPADAGPARPDARRAPDLAADLPPDQLPDLAPSADAGPVPATGETPRPPAKRRAPAPRRPTGRRQAPRRPPAKPKAPATKPLPFDDL